MPMGPLTGVWCLDVDTSEDHDDGVAGWSAVAAEHEPIVTREHRSATGGPHPIFSWNARRPLGCSAGALPDGISVKGKGGYIVVPPSRRKGRSYTVHSDIDPIDAPEWLTDLIGRSHVGEYAGANWETTADLDEVADAMGWIPNPDEAWEEWKSMAMRLYAALGDEGFALFDAWSLLSGKYDGGRTLEAWEQVQSLPPSRTGVEKIFKIAREHGWVRKAEPTYSGLDELSDNDAAREEIQSTVRKFLRWVAVPEDQSNSFIEVALLIARDPEWPLVWAALGPTGIGKTRIAVAELAAWVRKLSTVGVVMYMVPTHELGKDIVALFADAGLSAKVYRGREAINPDTLDPKLDPKDAQQERMCVNLEQVRLAYEAGVEVSTSCCLRKAKKGERERRCKFYDDACAFQQQLRGDQPDVWVAAHEMLFHPQKAFGDGKKIAAVIVDESFWQDGLRIQEHGVALSEMESASGCEELERLRGRLVKALRRQPNVGGFERRHFFGGDFLDNVAPENCTRAISLEYEMVEDVEMYPGMSARDLKRLARDVPAFKRARQMAAIWSAARHLLNRDDIEVSGHLVLKENEDGERFALSRGVAPVRKQYKVPTLLMDATLPDDAILQAYFPQVERVADIKVAMPHVYIRQVLEAPVSKKRLLVGIKERGENTTNRANRRAIRRYILRRWVETGRQPTLVVCQQKYENWLRGVGLPDGIYVEHFNNIEGLDRYKHVRLLITVGRTLPPPDKIETYAGALTGVQPVTVNNEKMAWYPRVTRGIRLADGSGVAATCVEHPDPTAEAVRWQVCGAQLIQSIGRGRGVNRTAETPLDVDIVSDVVLPLVINEVSHWRPPGAVVEMLAGDGIALTSPVDMVKARPDLWPDEKSADRALKMHSTLSLCSGAAAGTQGQSPIRYLIEKCPYVRPLRYQPCGAKLNRRTAVYDPAVLPDPRAWLEDRLGPLAFFEIK
jgi:putative DNA primase/helicase